MALAPLAATIIATLQPEGKRLRSVGWAIAAHLAVAVLLPVLTGTAQVMVGKVMEMSGMRQVNVDLLVAPDACRTLRAAGVATTLASEVTGGCWLQHVVVLAAVGDRHWVSCWRGAAAPNHVKDGFDLRTDEVLRTRRMRLSGKTEPSPQASSDGRAAPPAAEPTMDLPALLCGALSTGGATAAPEPAASAASAV